MVHVGGGAAVQSDSTVTTLVEKIKVCNSIGLYKTAHWDSDSRFMASLGAKFQNKLGLRFSVLILVLEMHICK